MKKSDISIREEYSYEDLNALSMDVFKVTHIPTDLAIMYVKGHQEEAEELLEKLVKTRSEILA